VHVFPMITGILGRPGYHRQTNRHVSTFRVAYATFEMFKLTEILFTAPVLLG